MAEEKKGDSEKKYSDKGGFIERPKKDGASGAQEAEAAGIKGMCRVCGMISDRACHLCGRPACERHMLKTGICVVCARGKRLHMWFRRGSAGSAFRSSKSP